MPHSLRCKIKHLCHNGTITESERDRILKALEQEPQTGHWVDENISEGCHKVFCSKCGCPPPFEHISTGDVYSASGYGVINKTKFCPNCGIKMESEGIENHD